MQFLIVLQIIQSPVVPGFPATLMRKQGRDEGATFPTNMLSWNFVLFAAATIGFFSFASSSGAYEKVTNDRDIEAGFIKYVFYEKIASKSDAYADSLVDKLLVKADPASLEPHHLFTLDLSLRRYATQVAIKYDSEVVRLRLFYQRFADALHYFYKDATVEPLTRDQHGAKREMNFKLHKPDACYYSYLIDDVNYWPANKEEGVYAFTYPLKVCLGQTHLPVEEKLQQLKHFEQRHLPKVAELACVRGIYALIGLEQNKPMKFASGFIGSAFSQAKLIEKIVKVSLLKATVLSDQHSQRSGTKPSIRASSQAYNIFRNALADFLGHITIRRLKMTSFHASLMRDFYIYSVGSPKICDVVENNPVDGILSPIRIHSYLSKPAFLLYATCFTQKKQVYFVEFETESSADNGRLWIDNDRWGKAAIDEIVKNQGLFRWTSITSMLESVLSGYH